MAVVRFYLPRDTSPSVSPAAGSAWTQSGSRELRTLEITKGSPGGGSQSFSTLAGGTDQALETFLRSTHVSQPLVAQTITAQTIKAQIMGNEANALNDLFLYVGIRVVSFSGVHKSDILVPTADDVELVVTTNTNRQFVATSTEQTLANGDRIVVELGHGGDNQAGGSHSGAIGIGNPSGTDLGENDTDTSTALVPWIEFSDIDYTIFQPPTHRHFENKRRPNMFVPGRAL